MYMAADLLISGVLRVVSCFGLSCSYKPVLRDLHTSVLSCHVYGCRSAHFWCSVCCVLFWPVLFLQTSVERPACCSSVLLCQWLLICAVMMFWVLRPVLACLVPGNQCWDTSCVLQSSPVLYMASDLCCQGVLSVLSRSDLLSSWKPVLRDILLASAVSCCVYVFWSVPSGILSVVWLLSCFWPVVFLETSVEIPSACCSPVLLYVRLLICGSWCFECCVLFLPVVFLEISVERLMPASVSSSLWLLIHVFQVFLVGMCDFCPVSGLLWGWVGLWGFLWWAPSAKRKDHHGVSSGWSSVWHRSNTGLSSTQYEQIPIILGVWPFWLTPFFFRSITFWRAYG